MPKHDKCPYCMDDSNDFIVMNDTMEYSGVEISLNRQGMIRVRVYDEDVLGGEVLLTQDLINVKFCPMCGRKLDKLGR